APGLESELPSTARLRRGGWEGRLARIVAVGLSLYALYWVVAIVPPQIYRVSFLLVALVLTFLVFPGGTGRGWRLLDAALIGLTIISLSWPIVDFAEFTYRAATPEPVDLALGAIAILLVLEATRRTVGPILPVTAAA